MAKENRKNYGTAFKAEVALWRIAEPGAKP